MKLTEPQRRHLHACCRVHPGVLRCGLGMGYNRGVARRLVDMDFVEVEHEYDPRGKYGILDIKITAKGRRELNDGTS